MDDKIKKKIERHAFMVNEIVHSYLSQLPKEMDEFDTIKMIYTIGKDCFIRGYAEGLTENEDERT